METARAIKGRRSIRRFQERDIPDSVLKELLGLAIHAPSSMNGQPWRFIVVRAKGTKERLVEIKNRYCPEEKKEYSADFLLNAPVIIVVCVERGRSHEREVENGVLATANLMLGAFAAGLGSVYLSAYRTADPSVSREIRELLNIPADMEPITIIPLGYPDEVPEAKVLVPLEERIHYETFGR